MDIPTLMYNLREEVTCSVCMQLYTNPKQLPCLHIFCLQCLNNLARTSARYGKIKCPLCQREVAVPGSGTLETLPNCFHMKNLLDILAIKECNKAKVTCGNCETKREEAAYCFHCGKFWCNDCLNGHNILRENKEHRVLALTDFEDKDFEHVLKRPVFCQKELHDKEVLKFYCKECNVPVCQTCVIVEHNKHDVEHLEVAAREVKGSIACKLDVAKESSNTISNCIRKLEKKSLLLEHRTKISKEQIHEIVNSLIVTLRQKEQESIAEVEKQYLTAQERIRTSKDELQDQLDKRNNSISQIEALVQRSPAAELVRAKTIINEMSQGLLEPQDMQPTADRNVTFPVFFKNEEFPKIIQQSRIGNLDEVPETETELQKCTLEGLKEGTEGLESQFELITRNSKGEQYYCPADVISVDIVSNQNEHVAEEIIITDEKNGRYKISYIPRKAGEHLMRVRINEEEMKEFPLALRITERYFTPLRCITLGTTEAIKLKYPWGVAVSDSNTIFVSDMRNNRIVVFAENGEFIRSFGENVLRRPTGLVVDNTGRLIVVNRLDGKILSFTSTGEYIGPFYNGDVLKEPRGMALDSQGNYIVCDAGNGCVRFISPQGNIFKTIGNVFLKLPLDCVCYENKIFVSDGGAHLVKVYNSNGKRLYQFRRQGSGDGEFQRPCGLAIDKTGHLLVCDFNSNRIQVLTLEGDFVTKFGKYGKKMGEMKGPNYISVLKSGHFVVCEYKNNRLQIFE